MNLINPAFAILTLLFIASGVYGQVTTSAINGSITDKNGEALPGATIIAVHTPTGSSYGTTARSNGSFNLPNLQVGGPYTIFVRFIGYKTEELTDIRLSLGEDRNYNIKLTEEKITLQEVVVLGKFDETFNSGRNGTATNISSEEVAAVPSIIRSINDLTRLTPQSSGTSFAGRDNRFNNYSIDGIIYNNNFGLGNSQFAGGDPLSLEAIEEVQVNLAPYDVRQGGFSGANVNAITKRGSNIYKGAVYHYFRNEKFTGNKIGEQDLNVADAFTKIYGASAGGPIFKDKLFFFFSIEQEKKSNPGLQKVASRSGLTPDGVTVSRVPADRLEFVSAKMKELYDYETGPYEKYDFADQGIRLNARIDYNINNKNKVMFRFNRYEAFFDETVNGNSLRYNPGALRYRNTDRFGIEAMNFRNSHYSVDINVTSVVGEWNSIISSKMANNFRAGFNMVEDPIRSVPGKQAFPFIEILEFEGATPLYYMTLGNELFSIGNQLSNDIFSVTNNFSYYAGRHNLTIGLNFEYMNFANAYNPAINGVYRFNSYDNFVKSVIDKDLNVTPDLFLQGYSFKRTDDIPLDETSFGQIGIYAQDKFDVTTKLNISMGLRIDLPFYPIDLPSNPNLDALNLEFTNPRNGEKIVPDVGVLPTVIPLLSPRFGFNYDVSGDRSLQLRGGSGMFTGRIPFVWISNQVNNNGVTRGGFGITGEQWGTGTHPSWEGFQPDVSYYRPDPYDLSAQVSTTLAITDKNFKLPQVWRSNLAVDFSLPFDIIATLEGIYSLDINSPLAVNINTNNPSQRLSAPYNFPYWESDTYYTNSSFNDVILLTNLNQGYYASITAQFEKNFGKFGSVTVAYTRSVSKDYGLEGGSQAASLWPFTVRDSRNEPELGFSRFDQPNRLFVFGTLNTQLLNSKLNTSLSLYYEGGEGGRFSYTYSGSFGDGADRLMYIPKTFEDSYLVDDGTLTTAEQWATLNIYIEQDPYLSKRRGEVAERNGAKLPWLNRLNIKITQDIKITCRRNSYKLQGFLDIYNLGNFINKEWGIGQTYNQRTLLNLNSVNAEGVPAFKLNKISGQDAYPSGTYRNIFELDQTWSAQIGVRLNFN